MKVSRSTRRSSDSGTRDSKRVTRSTRKSQDSGTAQGEGRKVGESSVPVIAQSEKKSRSIGLEEDLGSLETVTKASKMNRSMFLNLKKMWKVVEEERGGIPLPSQWKKD